MKTLQPFKDLAFIFNKYGFNLYLVGGSSRDFLLKQDFYEYDCATDATVEEMSEFITDADFSGSYFGCVKFLENGDLFEITTFRKESNYKDHRHPREIKFTREMSVDSNRRDFTINAIYIDQEENVYDFHHGLDDLKNETLKMIGNADERMREDPLRILRAIRFKLTLNFELDEELESAIKNNVALIADIKEKRRKSEIERILSVDEKLGTEILEKYGINID